ncbi:hypothetical protein [Glaciimonas sp. PCH181]|uniref:hypothetical protein n=1 Tax=Glaciimonas sp. PCH181 TaxID=2133943 RepID=UPI000D3B20C7|nr:hypothetical protein [Glaciimonas sp. PCH181]PUA18088.1 hypothetical protein C7W93_19885 [Glaciimonas sp. PCH181]
MKIIDNGNLTEGVRLGIFFLGILLGYLGLELEILNGWIRLILILLGFLLVAIGGISTKAHTLKIKPFDNSYKKAKESYKKEGKK